MFLADRFAEFSAKYLQVWEHLNTESDYKTRADQHLFYNNCNIINVEM
jgi:hypothetical protein